MNIRPSNNFLLSAVLIPFLWGLNGYMVACEKSKQFFCRRSHKGVYVCFACGWRDPWKEVMDIENTSPSKEEQAYIYKTDDAL